MITKKLKLTKAATSLIIAQRLIKMGKIPSEAKEVSIVATQEGMEVSFKVEAENPDRDLPVIKQVLH